MIKCYICLESEEMCESTIGERTFSGLHITLCSDCCTRLSLEAERTIPEFRECSIAYEASEFWSSQPANGDAPKAIWFAEQAKTSAAAYWETRLKSGTKLLALARRLRAEHDE